MADYDSGLPIRSEADGSSERVHVKVVDYTSPDANQLEVDSDNNAHVEVHGNRVDDQADVTLELTEEGKAIVRGDYEADDNSEPSSAGIIGHSREAAKTQAHQLKRISAVDGENDSTCLDVAWHDADGNEYDADNPVPVSFEESPGDETHDYDTAAAIAKDATDDHTYSVADGKTFLLYGVHARASGKMKAELLIGDGGVSEVFASKDVNFNSTAHPEADMDFFRVPIKIVGTANTTTIKLTRTNLDNQAQDLYSTFIGVERDT